MVKAGARRLGWATWIFVLCWPLAAQAAWNPLRSAASGLARAGRAVGSYVGGQLGGFVERATAPSIRNVEKTGHALLDDLDIKLDRQLDNVSSVTAKLVAQVDGVVGKNLDQVDRSLGARLLQLETSGDAIIARTFARLDHTLGKLDDVLGKRIDQVLAGAEHLVTRVDDTVARTLAQADAILAQRLDEVDELVGASIERADRVAAARIDQLDEVAGRRIGNLDTIATKQSLAIEGGMLRLAAFVGLIVFLAFVFWRLFVVVGEARLAVTAPEKRLRRVAGHAAPRFGLQLAIAALACGALLYLGHVLPMRSEKVARKQLEDHTAGFATAIAAYDFTQMRYHAAQLEILDPEHARVNRALVRKAELLRTVLERPALLQSLSGIGALQLEVNTVEAEVDQAIALLGGSGKDPDLLVLKAFILWQVGSDRADERDAALLCVDALESRATRLPGGFLLEPLAWNYLDTYLANPLAGPELERLRVQASRATAREDAPRFAHLIAYDRLVLALQKKAVPAYLAMLRAHASFVKTGDRAAWQARQDGATALLAAWQEFDAALEASPWLADSVTAMAVFTLDDSVPMRAKYLLLAPESPTLAPPFFAPPPARKAKDDAKLRLKMAPLRVAWEQRYAPLLGPGARDVLAFEESERFRQLEERTRRFEEAYVAVLVGSAGPDVVNQAALDAADLGLVEDGKPLAETILADRRAPPEVAELLSQRKLRLF